MIDDVRRVARNRNWERLRSFLHRKVTVPLRLRTNRLGDLPSCLLIGAMKAGTTSLFAYLAQHPQVDPPLYKETHFFTFRYSRGTNWYRANFPTLEERDSTITLEATPAYLLHPAAPERAARTLEDDTQILVLLRNPVERAYSHFKHMRRAGHEPLASFQKALRREEDRIGDEEKCLPGQDDASRAAHRIFSYKKRGRYAPQLERWLEEFPREHVHVFFSEALFEGPETLCQGLFDVLDLSPCRVETRVRNQGQYDPMDPEVRASLESYFEEPNRNLEKLLGRSVPW